jgi:hypothetical protein
LRANCGKKLEDKNGTNGKRGRKKKEMPLLATIPEKALKRTFSFF